MVKEPNMCSPRCAGLFPFCDYICTEKERVACRSSWNKTNHFCSRTISVGCCSGLRVLAKCCYHFCFCKISNWSRLKRFSYKNSTGLNSGLAKRREGWGRFLWKKFDWKFRDCGINKNYVKNMDYKIRYFILSLYNGEEGRYILEPAEKW